MKKPNLETFKRLERRMKSGWNKHGQLMTAIFAGGFAILAVISAVQASEKTVDIKDQSKADLLDVDDMLNNEEITKEEAEKKRQEIKWRAAKDFACNYGKTICCLALSVGFTAYGYKASIAKQAAMVGAYKLLESKSDEKIESLKAALGEKKSEEVEKKLIEDHRKSAGPIPENCLRNEPVAGENDLNDISLLDYPCWDEWSGRYFKSNRTKIETALIDAAHELGYGIGTFLPMNYIYDRLGMVPSASGGKYGFTEKNTDRGKIPCKFYTLNDEIYGPVLVMSLEPDIDERW